MRRKNQRTMPGTASSNSHLTHPMNSLLRVLFAFAFAATAAATPIDGLTGQLTVHDPSTIVECGGRYYVFSTGRGIPFLSSADGMEWRREGRVFERIPETVRKYVPKNDGVDVWAPDIIKVRGQYLLYYSVSTWGQYESAIGLMTSSTLDPASPDYRWTDRGMIVHSVKGQNLNSIDPSVLLGPDGRLWMCYGSYLGNIELIELDPATGLRIAPDSPVSVIASHSEAAALAWHDGWYYLFVNHGSCCAGVNSSYHILMGRSKEVTGPYLDKDGDDLVTGAGSLFMAAKGKWIGPGHFGRWVVNGVEKVSLHYEGELGSPRRSFLSIQPLLWTAAGWPEVGVIPGAGVHQIRSRRIADVLELQTSREGVKRALTAHYMARPHQQWNLVPAEGGSHRIVNTAENTALAVVTVEEQGKPGFALALAAPDPASRNQLWKIDALSDGSYRIAAAEGGQVLTSIDGHRKGNHVAVEPDTGAATQRWDVTAP